MFDDPEMASLGDALKREARRSLEAFARTPKGLAVRGLGALIMACRAEGRVPTGEEIIECLRLARGACEASEGVP